MNRLPLSDEVVYRFRPPRHHPVYLWMTNRFLKRVARSYVRVESFEVSGDATIKGLLARGDGVLLAPNHSDHGDSFSVLELSRRVGRAFHFMAAYQIFQGFRGHLLSRVGAFPVDREGADLTAFKTAVDLLGRGRNPLVIFPEGEIHHLCDVVTPLREGAAAIACAAAKRLGDSGKTVWIVPVGMKYRFLDHCDPTPALLDLMDELERRAHWFVDRDRPIVERLYRYAEGMMGLKEFEYLGKTNPGALPERLTLLREEILSKLEARHAPEGRRKPNEGGVTVPGRVKEVRRSCLEKLQDPATSPEEARALRRDLHDVFVAFQTYSYPGNYLRGTPTLERLAETLMKCEEDFLGIDESLPRGPRKAVLRVGEPIDVREHIAAVSRPRQALTGLTIELERRIQAALDAIGPGRPLPRTVVGPRETGHCG